MNRDIINIKGTRNGLVICLDPTHDFEDLKNTLRVKIEAARGFFKGAKFTFHQGYESLTAEKTKELEAICCAHGLVPDINITWPARPEKASTPPRTADTRREAAMAENVRPLMKEASPSLPAVGITDSDRKPCLMVNRGLRSGQKINYNGNVVVMGDVNPGSEITACGDIIVMGSLRGLVHAGADGNEASVIMAYRLNPVQLRIASTITRPPENSLPGAHPEIARLKKGHMIIEPYITYGLR